MDVQATLKDLVIQFLSQLGFSSDYELLVDHDPEPNLYRVTIQTADPTLLIGYHGDTVSALQLFLGQHLHAATGEWHNLSLNINDYRQRREQALHTMVDSVVEKVVSTSQPHALPPLPAGERRVIHLHLTDHPQVVSASQGEGRYRSVVISPKV